MKQLRYPRSSKRELQPVCELTKPIFRSQGRDFRLTDEHGELVKTLFA